MLATATAGAVVTVPLFWGWGSAPAIAAETVNPVALLVQGQVGMGASGGLFNIGNNGYVKIGDPSGTTTHTVAESDPQPVTITQPEPVAQRESRSVALTQ